MPDLLLSSIRAQFEASVCMLSESIAACPEQHWDGLIARYPFWHVAYHTLCFVDCYTRTSNDAWQPHPVFHPASRAELDDEFPSRRFTRDELIAYAALCRQMTAAAFDAETPETLAGPSGFAWLKFPRAEAHIYNIRHIQHHTGQLTAYLRRVGALSGQNDWVKRGWR